MSEFVNRSIGNRQHSYPDTRPGSNSPPGGAFARNYAVGPANDTPIATGAGTQIPWRTTDVAGVGFEDIPITPQSTGQIMIRGMIGVSNSAGVPHTLHVALQLDDVTLPVPADVEVTVPAAVGGEEASGFVEVPFIFKYESLAIGVTRQFQILLTALTSSVLTLTDNNSTLEVEEVPLSTG